MNKCVEQNLLREKLRQMIDGYRISQVICVAAELGIADLLQGGPKSGNELAAATRANPHVLFRVLRTLGNVGVLRPVADGCFALAPLGEWLRSDSADSLRPWALLSARMYRAWGEFPDCIRTGEGGLGSGYGEQRWMRLEQLPGEARVFHDAMGANSAWLARAVLEAYDFSAFRSIVDVGGGNGTLLACILAACPGARGVVFDLPEAIRHAGPRLEAAGLAERCQLQAGSFFGPLPPGGDAYLLSRVLHDWDDEHATRILQSTRRAVSPGTTLLVIERLLDLESSSAEAALSDLNMLLMNGGRERTSAEFAALFVASGFNLVRAVTTRTPLQILEAVSI